MGKKLYVGNLTYGVTDSTLEQMFTAHGTVESAQVIMDRETGAFQRIRLRGNEVRPGGPGGNHRSERQGRRGPRPDSQRGPTKDRRWARRQRTILVCFAHPKTLREVGKRESSVLNDI